MWSEGLWDGFYIKRPSQVGSTFIEINQWNKSFYQFWYKVDFFFGFVLPLSPW